MLDACDAGAGELRAAHHLEHPADLLADHDGGDALVGGGGVHHLGRARGAVVERDEVHRPGARERHASPRRRGSRAVLFTTMVDDGGHVDGGGERAHRLAGERLADVARLLVAHPHRLDDVVGAARARRVVGAVQDQLAPPDVEQRARVVGRVRAASADSGSA